ncbi:PLP-dependent aminotransferase family protein [Roseibium sp. SCPC15]|uniref:aminotransferase-like domain-containing protein n=1 Tax=Roseibium sp. SCP15 TaxID=3141376 RepID=UPI003335B9E1
MAIWIPDLKGRRGPKYLQIVDAMAEDIASGHLLPNAKLLPHREMAYQLGISANTTSRAYAEATRRALLRGEVGRGTFVRAPGAILENGEQGSLLRQENGPIDLSRNLPLPGFSEPHIRRILKKIAADARLPTLLDYQTDNDLAHHNEAARIWLSNCGIDAATDQIVMTMGGQHGLLCSLMSVLNAGDLLLTEALTYTPVRAIAERQGLNTAVVEMDECGIIPEAFEELCKRAKPKAFYLTPTLQAPTTLTLSAQRRMALAALAQQYNVVLIEDDVFGPLKIDRPPPVATFAPDHTIYVTSLSKSVAPGLRVGFLYAPSRLVPALRHAINLSVWMTPPMTLEIATRVINDGTAFKLAKQQRDAAAHRQTLARTVLKNVDYTSDPNGLHMWIRLPADWRADSFRAQCAKHGVLVTEGRSFAAPSETAPEAVRICLSHEVSELRLTKGLQVLASLHHQAPSTSVMEI